MIGRRKGFLTNIVCLSIIFLSMNCCSSHVSHIFCLHVYIFERDNCTPTQLDYNIIIPMHTSINLKSTTGQAKYFYCIIIGFDIWPFPIFYNALYFIQVACRIIGKITLHKFKSMSFKVGWHNVSIQLNTQLRIMANKLKIYLNGFYDRSIRPGMYICPLCKYKSRTCSLIFWANEIIEIEFWVGRKF